MREIVKWHQSKQAYKMLNFLRNSNSSFKKIMIRTPGLMQRIHWNAPSWDQKFWKRAHRGSTMSALRKSFSTYTPAKTCVTVYKTMLTEQFSRIFIPYLFQCLIIKIFKYLIKWQKVQILHSAQNLGECRCPSDFGTVAVPIRQTIVCNCSCCRLHHQTYLLLSGLSLSHRP